MKSISVKELAALGKEAAIVDVREDDEFAAVRVSGAKSVPLSRFPQSLAEVPATGTVYVMCAAGGRSSQATAYLTDQGYDAVNVTGGINEWQLDGLPVQRG
ncbi:MULTISPECIES: rhodanese-like domain-containing protein [unclassified Arthrobacter]|uniref:rhodanese-like domain-containing protein n=1 Tax=unclassified Arthrobacter TaxID=235627 RepID=UPI002DF85771|nr:MULTISPECIES: rhodanese-like domain-containing protein [unclassified Arthrobacter]MEC5192839.1 rhodanese-related sulfurtransferase [Arthrobacter sp. MP_M4]MEC5204276.1 rhodanese-related sulfurtransferase [Arthrobacter sp. MP_M7]